MIREWCINMTRKNYKSLVKILARNNINFDDHAELIGSIMSWFKEDNSNFCKYTFENALKEELEVYNSHKLSNELLRSINHV
jgi:hypothetical protein